MKGGVSVEDRWQIWGVEEEESIRGRFATTFWIALNLNDKGTGRRYHGVTPIEL